MILVDICEGLLWMHTHPSGSTAHGDLKPENVLLRENNRAFLCDLGGSAAFEQHMTQTTGEFGTFEYNSPERVMDSKGTGTAASDVWSLGVVAYRMVTGRGLCENMNKLQTRSVLENFNESNIPTTIPASVRAVLLKMLEPNVSLRATTSALLEGGLLEGMLGSSTDLSRMKSIQLGTLVNEMKESLNDAEVEKRTMKLSMEKEKLLLETQELEDRLRSLQMSLQRTRSRNVDLEKEEELERCHHLLSNHVSPVSISTEDNILSTIREVPHLLFFHGDSWRIDEALLFDVSGNTITRKGVAKNKEWSTTLFEEPISEGVVSVAITVLAIPEAVDSREGLMFGLIDTVSGHIKPEFKLGEYTLNSIALAPRTGTLHINLPSTSQLEEKHQLSLRLNEGDRVVLEVDMDARPRTAVFIINGNVPLTFVSGLPPSIRFGLSMKNKGVSVRFDGMSRLKRATPLRRVNEIEWNPEDIRDSEDLYMNGMRSSVLTVHTQIPSLDFSDPSHFTVEDNRISYTGIATKENNEQIEPMWNSFFLPGSFSEGIVAVSFTLFEDLGSDPFYFGLIDGAEPIPDGGDPLGEVQNSVALSSYGRLYFLTADGQLKTNISPSVSSGESFIIEINMDSNPRTAQFFVDEKPANVVVVGLPESVRVGFSVKKSLLHVRFNRITHLNRGSPFTNRMNVVEWPAAEPSEESEVDEDSDGNDEEVTNEGEEKVERDSQDEGSIDDSVSEDEGKSEKSDADNDQPSDDGLDRAKGAPDVVDDEPDDEKDDGEDADETEEKDSLDEGSINDNTDDEESMSEEGDVDDDQPSEDNINETEDEEVDDGEDDEDADEDIDHSSERMMEKAEDNEESNGDSEDDTDEGSLRAESDSDVEDDEADAEKKSRQLPTLKLPELLFTRKSHFAIRHNVLTRTEKGTDEKGRARPSTVLFSEPITKGVVSVTFDVVTLADSIEEDASINFGLLDSSLAVPRLGRVLGKNVKHSLALSTSHGELPIFTQTKLEVDCCASFSKNDRVVMEVNMDSTPRTVQFFVNGKAGKCYVSGIPESVRIGFSADLMGTSLEIASIVHSTQATPLTDKMKEIRWTDTKESLKESSSQPRTLIRREAEGSMPALLSRNPEHFKIEGNVITRTAFDFNGLDSPFSTVMLDGVVEKMIKSVTVTILALPETEHSSGVVMLGGLFKSKHIPKSPKGLGIRKKGSFALCSSDGMIHLTDWENSYLVPCHSPLRVGDQVVLEVNTRSKPDISRFFVNGKAGLIKMDGYYPFLRIGFSLAGPGTSIRIDAVTEQLLPEKVEISKLIVKCASSGDEFPFNVTLQHTILQIKESLVPLMNVSIETITLSHDSDELSDSTTLSEIDFDGDFVLVATSLQATLPSDHHA
ncbi:putative Protein kinase domain containing protein [Blattamonas nauphoetae]|uniref:Protein kinase domain-containing protein n=1 Tax=Blattamonas nauphoetae TaxID=2049346 RepID=A0ABQ9XBC8_9EUKA|nr:putative Protein kinase domain containing protein [Blattamonas nauphoetae]